MTVFSTLFRLLLRSNEPHSTFLKEKRESRPAFPWHWAGSVDGAITRTYWSIAGLFLAYLLIFWPVVALQANVIGEEPRVIATAYSEIPPGSSITIELRDNTEMSDWIKELMTQDLRAQGYEVNDNGDLSLRFETQLVTVNQSGIPVDISGSSDRGYGNNFTVGFKLPIGEPPGRANQSHITLSATLSPRGQAPLWSGKSIANTRHRQLVDIDPELVKSLVANIGKTVGPRQY
ncbi:MAG: hypothetical protein AAF530_17730 [Pseudomonadota bacterium]